MFTFNPSGKLTEISDNIFDFDKYSSFDPTFVSRYLIQASIIDAYKKHAKTKRPSVLDVGGAGSLLDAFSDAKLHIIDIQPIDYPNKNYTVGNALNMPFKDKQFDVVISCDVLEHIKKDDRKQFIKECTRVSRGLVIISAPFNLTGVRLAEISANNFYKSLTGDDHIWLKEHLQDELPELYQTKRIFTDLGFGAGYFTHTSLDYWQLLTRLSFLMAPKYSKHNLADNIQIINKFYLDKIMPKDFSDTGYRSFIIAAKDNIHIDKTPDRLDADLENTFSLLTEIIVDLL